VHHGFSESNEEAKHDDDPEDEDDDARDRLILFDILNHVDLRLYHEMLKIRTQQKDNIYAKSKSRSTKCHTKF